MKIDMHCHTKEGSIDAKVKIENYINKLISNGCNGMLVTDHNSYNGYRKFKEIANRMNLKEFTVLKGIEYDTKDAGHIIAILPEHINEKILEVRGMKVKQLEKLVHGLGGVLGPAHPYGTGYYAFANTKFGKNNMNFIKKFDFIETFNACTKPHENMLADRLAECFNKLKTGGSDAHKEDVVGMAFTEFSDIIRNNDDLISAIKSNKATKVHGNVIEKKLKKSNVIIEEAGIIGYYIYNRLGAWLNKDKLTILMVELHNRYLNDIQDICKKYNERKEDMENIRKYIDCHFREKKVVQ